MSIESLLMSNDESPQPTVRSAPASVTISGTAAATTTLTVSTASTKMASTREGESSSRTLTVLACGLPLLGLLTLVPVARGRRLLLCVGFALFVSMTSMTGCRGGSSEPKTAAGTYSFNPAETYLPFHEMSSLRFAAVIGFVTS
jgi:hypothetical protein